MKNFNRLLLFYFIVIVITSTGCKNEAPADYGKLNVYSAQETQEIIANAVKMVPVGKIVTTRNVMINETTRDTLDEITNTQTYLAYVATDKDGFLMPRPQKENQEAVARMVDKQPPPIVVVTGCYMICTRGSDPNCSNISGCRPNGDHTGCTPGDCGNGCTLSVGCKPSFSAHGFGKPLFRY
jgi:hypothetical protein